MNTEKNKSMLCVKENIITKVIKFIKKIFKRNIQQSDIENKNSLSTNNLQKTKQEILEIYSEAKKGKYDLNKLQLEEIQMLNKLIESEIEIKTKKLDQIITETKIIKKY